MSIWLPHTYDILKPVEPLTRYLTARQLDHWRRDTATWKDSGRRDLPLPKPLQRIILAMPSTAAKMLLLLSGKAVVTWSSYVTATIAPVGWWSMRATSGTNEPNRGTGGAALDMTITSATLGQTGKLGANEAALCDGANSRYQTANNAALAALTTWEYVFLVNPSSVGENALGQFFAWGNGAAAPGDNLCQFENLTIILRIKLFNTTPTVFDTITSSGLSASVWSLLFVAYDNAGDRKAHAYAGVTGAVSECTYTAQAAITGTYRASSNVLNLWNRTDQARTFAGLVDEAMVVNGNLATATTRKQLAVLAGV